MEDKQFYYKTLTIYGGKIWQQKNKKKKSKACMWVDHQENDLNTLRGFWGGGKGMRQNTGHVFRNWPWRRPNRRPVPSGRWTASRRIVPIPVPVRGWWTPYADRVRSRSRPTNSEVAWLEKAEILIKSDGNGRIDFCIILLSRI